MSTHQAFLTKYGCECFYFKHFNSFYAYIFRICLVLYGILVSAACYYDYLNRHNKRKQTFVAQKPGRLI